VLEACCCLPHLPLLLKREQKETEAFFFRNRLHQRPWEKKKIPANVRPVVADVQEEEQSRFTGRTIKSNKHLRGPIVREEASPERGLPQLEDSSIIPAKGSDVNATSSTVSQVVQARTDAVIGRGGSKALGLGFSSRIDTTTTSSPRAMGGNNKKKQISRAPAFAVLSGTVSGRGRCRR
jgi:hypothetical protein